MLSTLWIHSPGQSTHLYSVYSCVYVCMHVYVHVCDRDSSSWSMAIYFLSNTSGAVPLWATFSHSIWIMSKTLKLNLFWRIMSSLQQRVCSEQHDNCHHQIFNEFNLLLLLITCRIFWISYKRNLTIPHLDRIYQLSGSWLCHLFLIN